MQDQPRKRRQPSKPHLDVRTIPPQIDIPVEVKLPHDIHRAITHHLIGDISTILRPHISGVRNLHQPPPLAEGVQRTGRYGQIITRRVYDERANGAAEKD
jgi:hypothetical protein